MSTTVTKTSTWSCGAEGLQPAPGFEPGCFRLRGIDWDLSLGPLAPQPNALSIRLQPYETYRGPPLEISVRVWGLPALQPPSPPAHQHTPSTPAHPQHTSTPSAHQDPPQHPSIKTELKQNVRTLFWPWNPNLTNLEKNKTIFDHSFGLGCVPKTFPE